MLFYYLVVLYFFFFFKQKTAYEMRISDWSSDVCSSDLRIGIADDPVSILVGDGGADVVTGNREQLLPDLHRCQIRLVDRGITFVIARYDRHVGLVQKDERPDEIGRASGRERVCQDG